MADVLSLGSRIMCVSDVFTAITEDRPYRTGMPQKEVLGVLHSMVKSNAIDADIVKLLEQNLEEVNGIRDISQAESREMYRDIIARVRFEGIEDLRGSCKFNGKTLVLRKIEGKRLYLLAVF